MLRFLSDLGIVPGTRLRLTERGPFDSPLMLAVEETPDVVALGPGVASQIHVVPVEADSVPARD
jgi:Fe2+ transport system protein FeoA